MIDPVDWVSTAVECLTGQCSGTDVLFAALPVVNGGMDNAAHAAKVTANALDTANTVENAEEAAKAVESALNYGNAGNKAVPSNLDNIAADVEDWVGQGEDMIAIRNGDGDFILRNQSNTRRFRFDFYNTNPHQNPHMHLEWFDDVTQKWIKPGQIYPSDVQPH